MTVWLIDAPGLSRLLGRFAPGSLRPARRRATAPRTTPQPTAKAAVPEPALAAPAAEPIVYEPVETRFEPLTAPPTTGRRRKDRVPSAYTAVEGTYREVARTPLWRKLVSLVLLVVVLAVVGVAIAAIAGATFGIVAELVDGAVG